ncbi:MAG TPA: GNAT family N-acetyltransferase [Acidimicrobiia bacterium]|nr:GNAT family N-acetyltransferase [Acidimicrobiia bacterium]
MTVTVRRAEPGECGALSHLALRSKAHWGYDERFLAACKAELTVDPALVERHRVTVAEESREIAGFSALAGAPPVGELTFLFVEPGRIGAGIGRTLWRECVATAARVGLSEIRIESDPNAAGFYAAMGAVRIGDARSQSIPDRRLPVLSFDMAHVPIDLRPVGDLASDVEAVLADVRRELAAVAPGVDVEHVGATSMPDGVTKGDVDVNLRVDGDRFDAVVVALSTRFDIAQPRNWSGTFASFSDTRRGVPIGIQVTVTGSDDDVLVDVRERMRADPELRRHYDETKRANAQSGRAAYWHAKDEFLRRTRKR